MIPEENGALGEKNTIIQEKTISTDFLEICHLTVTFIMIEFFGLFLDIKKVIKNIYI